MIISNHNNSTIRIQSEYLERLIQSASPDISICVTGKKNCGSESYEHCISPATFWGLDLNNEFFSNMVMTYFRFKNIQTDKEFDIEIHNEFGSGFFLDSNLSSLEFIKNQQPQMFADFKTSIDSFFTALGITSNVTVDAVVNVLKISNLPAGFVPIYTTFMDSTLLEYFTYGNSAVVSILGNNTLEIKPSLFEESSLSDGVYTFEITGYDGSVNFNEVNCAFIDVNTKCRVAKTLKSLVEEFNQGILKDRENESTYIHLLHYALVIGSNQGCNCDNLCKAYEELIDLLESVESKTQNTSYLNGCGC